jgi:hypothetical protein
LRPEIYGAATAISRRRSQGKAKAQTAKSEQIVADANAQQADAAKRLKQVEARERAVTEAMAKAERAEADANRVRKELQGKIDYLRNQLREIA